MREILEDLDPQDQDPVKKAQKAMQRPLPKRFYKSADVQQVEDVYGIFLDGKSVKTPARKPVALPTLSAAQMIADEFNAQEKEINPATMSVTRLVNTAIDGVASDTQAVVEDILRFCACDLLCYRATTPQSLVDRQSESWDPVLDWAHSQLGAQFILGEGIMHVEQPRAAVNAISIHMRDVANDAFVLAALHSMTTLTGSALLAIAVLKGELSHDEAWAIAHVDEDWNGERWGEDFEATKRREARSLDMRAAGEFLLKLND